MTVAVSRLTRDELVRNRADLLDELRVSEEDLRRRVDDETATAAERIALERLEEIAFLLGEDA